MIKTPARTGEDGVSAGPGRGALIVNADDWGRDGETTDRTLDCVLASALSSVSAMVFMQDSERAAELALKHGIAAGLHINLTTEFSGSGVSSELVKYQERLASFLRGSRFSRMIFHPGLKRSFEYVVNAQREEFARLYGAEPGRVDGHHHMHLCTNVLMGDLLPHGVLVRRNFSFQPGEKSSWNRAYRQAVDRILAKRYVLTDYFFSLPPMDPRERIQNIFLLAKDSTVEVETHPVNREEHKFLAGGEIFRWTEGVPVVQGFGLTAALQH